MMTMSSQASLKILNPSVQHLSFGFPHHPLLSEELSLLFEEPPLRLKKMS
jgi:hypothetical protein